MKTTFSALVIALGLALTSFSSIGSSQTNTPVNENLDKITDSIAIVLNQRYGYDLKLDPSLKNGSINYLKEVKSGRSLDPVEGQGHIHTSAMIPLEYYNLIPYSFFYELAYETIEAPEFASYFKSYVPTKFWVEEVVVGDQCYFIVSID